MPTEHPRMHVVRMTKKNAVGHAWAALKGRLLVDVVPCPVCGVRTVVAYGDRIDETGRECGHEAP